MSTPDHWTAYQRVKVVGRGAHGFAILCKRRKDNSLVVIKELFSTHASEAQESLNEIQVLSIVKHPNIVRYFDSFTAETKDEHEIEDESATDKESAAVNPFKGISSKSGATIPKTLYIVMEYADGGTMDTFLGSLTAPLPEKEILHMFSQIAFALHHIHSLNILHRDLKTNNIFISGSGPNRILKIGDFGISKFLNTGTKAETVVGTPSYLSPELCEGKPYNDKSDIWAMGCILYEIICLQKMFQGSNLPALVMKIMKGVYPQVPDTYSENLRSLVASCVQLEPSSRPSTQDLMGNVFLQSHLLDTQFSIGRILPTDDPIFA